MTSRPGFLELPVALLPMPVTENPRSWNDRLGALMKRLLLAIPAERWILCGYEDGQLHHFSISDGDVDALMLLDIVSSISSPRDSNGAISTHLLCAPDKRTILVASVRLSESRNVKLALVLAKTDTYRATEGSAFEPFVQDLERLAFEPGEMGAIPPPLPRRTLQAAMFVLNANFEIELQWQANELALDGLADIYRSHNGRLPRFLEIAVRGLTATWDPAVAATCSPGAKHLMPGFVLRTVPMQGPTGISIGVLLELYLERKTIRNAATTFRVSSRERQVLWLLLDGEPIVHIADRLHMAESTVQDHVKRLIQKTNSRNRTEMVAKVLGWPLARFEIVAKPSSHGVIE